MKKIGMFVVGVSIISSLLVGCSPKTTNSTSTNNATTEKKLEVGKNQIIIGVNSLNITPENEMTNFNSKNGGSFYKSLKASHTDYIDKNREMYNLNVDNNINIFGSRNIDTKEAYDATLSMQSPDQETKMASTAVLALISFCGDLPTEDSLSVLQKLGFDKDGTSCPSKDTKASYKGFSFKCKIDNTKHEIDITLFKDGGSNTINISDDDKEEINELKYVQGTDPEQDRAMIAEEKNEENVNASMKIVASGDRYTIRISPVSKNVLGFLAPETSTDVNYNNVTEKELGDINSSANAIKELLGKEKLPKRLVVTFMPYSCNEQESGYLYKRRYKDVYEILLFNNSTSLADQFKTQFEKYKEESKE